MCLYLLWKIGIGAEQQTCNDRSTGFMPYWIRDFPSWKYLIFNFSNPGVLHCVEQSVIQMSTEDPERTPEPCTRPEPLSPSLTEPPALPHPVRLDPLSPEVTPNSLCSLTGQSHFRGPAVSPDCAALSSLGGGQNTETQWEEPISFVSVRPSENPLDVDWTPSLIFNHTLRVPKLTKLSVVAAQSTSSRFCLTVPFFFFFFKFKQSNKIVVSDP